ncbi:hypothetical protein WJX81_006172 [Elliptochloris bilobata]|uniref:Peptidase C14 caspase domain-containing protein n=1 Tax=Elliptochloris bilobata TaxID=381761 RepID=A0AAW1R058_9CHLO
MGACASRPEVHDAGLPDKQALPCKPQVPAALQAPVLTAQPSPTQTVVSSKQPLTPGTPRQDTIPAKLAFVRAELPAGAGPLPPHACTPPSPLAQAPSGVLLPGLELPYAAPFVPPPSLPPPEHARSWGEREGGRGFWRPARRRAVLVGVNYAGAGEGGAALRGCVRDAHCLHALLTARFGFQPEDVVLLHDLQPHSELLPTKANILAALDWLVAVAAAGDSLVFGFCGHGVPGFAEGGAHALLPCDFCEEGGIAETDMSERLVQRLPAGARLHCVVDACRGDISLGLPARTLTRPDSWADWQVDVRTGEAPACRGGGGGEAVLLSGTLANPEDPDADPEPHAFSGFESTGAMTFALIQAAELGQAGTYQTLLRAMRYSLKNGPQHFPAAPRLAASRCFDLNRPFCL